MSLERRFGQHIDVNQHRGADQGGDQAAKKDRATVKQGEKKDGDSDAHAHIDDAADFHAFAPLDACDVLLLTKQFDRGVAALTGRLGNASNGIGLVKGLTLLAAMFHPGGCGEKDAEERYRADREKNPHAVRHQYILGTENKLEH